MAQLEASQFSRISTQIASLGPGIFPNFHVSKGTVKRDGFAAPYLPILDEIEDGRGNKMPIVIQAGMIVGLDEYGYVVPVTGYYVTGEGVTMTYSASDVKYKVIDYDNITDAYMIGTERNWSVANMAAPPEGASTRKLPTVSAMGIAVTNVIAHPEVLRRYSGSWNYSHGDPVSIAMGTTFEVPVLCSGTAAAKNGDLLMVGKPTDNTFSAANFLTMARFVPVNITDAVGNTTGNINTVVAETEAVLKSVIAKCLFIRRIDNVTGILDKKDIPAGTNFQYRVTASSTITDYYNLEEHLVYAQELDRSIGLTPTTVKGKWALVFNLIVS